MTNYITLQKILEEAGLAHNIYAETPAGVVDGSNKIFTVQNKPLTDANYDDTVTKDDIRVYFNGVPVEVSAVDATFGIITTASAPAEDVDVTIDYRYSAVTLEFAAELRDEAKEYIDNFMRSVDSCVPYGENGKTVPKIVRNIARQLAAAWLLIRDYGYNQDIEGTSKDGFKRLETALESLERYEKKGGACGSDGTGTAAGSLNSLEASSDGDLFADEARELAHSEPPHSDRGW